MSALTRKIKVNNMHNNREHNLGELMCFRGSHRAAFYLFMQVLLLHTMLINNHKKQ